MTAARFVAIWSRWGSTWVCEDTKSDRECGADFFGCKDSDLKMPVFDPLVLVPIPPAVGSF